MFYPSLHLARAFAIFRLRYVFIEPYFQIELFLRHLPFLTFLSRSIIVLHFFFDVSAAILPYGV